MIAAVRRRIGPALDSLAELDGPFDLVFIDADKGGYLRYLDAVLPLLRTSGLILVDNTLWSGAVVRPADHGTDTAHVQAFNDAVAADDRLESVILPISDGVTLIRKR